jgi:hypothetical protein
MILQSIMGGNAPPGGGSLDMATILSKVAGGGVDSRLAMERSRVAMGDGTEKLTSFSCTFRGESTNESDIY